MERFYVLRNKDGEFFAGFSRGSRIGHGHFTPAFVKPGQGKSVQAQVISDKDIEETETDLARFDIKVDRVQVG